MNNVLRDEVVGVAVLVVKCVDVTGAPVIEVVAVSDVVVAAATTEAKESTAVRRIFEMKTPKHTRETQGPDYN